MTVFYGEKIEVVAVNLETQTATCKISMVEIDGRDMDTQAAMSMLGPEEQKKLQKELARRKAKIEKYNPSMSPSKNNSKFGGYGGSRERELPLSKLLSGREKAELRNIMRRVRKGHTAELMRYYGTTSLNEILEKFYSSLKKNPRIRRVVGIDSTGCLCMELRTIK